jgi:hypothetical protein
MSTYPKYPQRPHDTGSLLGSLLVAGIILAIILFFTQ